MAHRPPLTAEERHDIIALVNDFLAKTGISDSQLAKDAGVDQPMIHNLKKGELKLRTPRLSRLELYIHMKNEQELAGEQHPVLREVNAAILDFIAAGGDPSLLSRGIRVLAGAAPVTQQAA